MGGEAGSMEVPKGSLVCERPWRILREVSRCFSTKPLRTFEGSKG